MKIRTQLDAIKRARQEFVSASQEFTSAHMLLQAGYWRVWWVQWRGETGSDDFFCVIDQASGAIMHSGLCRPLPQVIPVTEAYALELAEWRSRSLSWTWRGPLRVQLKRSLKWDWPYFGHLYWSVRTAGDGHEFTRFCIHHQTGRLIAEHSVPGFRDWYYEESRAPNKLQDKPNNLKIFASNIDD